MLNLDKRAATLGTSFNGRAQNKGQSKEKVPAFDVQLDGIILGEKEFNALLGDPHAEEAFFEAPGKKSTLVVPRFPKLQPLCLKEKIKGAKVSIWLQGEKKPIVLDGCDLNRITLTLMDGGTVSLSCQVQCAEPGDGKAAAIFGHLTQTCTVEIVELQTDVEDAAA